MAEAIENLVVKDGWLDPLVKTLSAQGVRVLAPVGRDGQIELGEIDSADQMAPDYVNTRTPLKELLFPRTEVLLEFDKAPGAPLAVHGAEAEIRPTVVFGARSCDLSALGVLDAVLNWDYRDEPYAQRRAKTTFVGFACSKSDEDCFCDAVGGSGAQNDGSDLFVRPVRGGGSVLEVMTERGQALAKQIPEATPVRGDEALEPPAATPARFDAEKIKGWLDTHFDDDFWLDVSLRCLGCGACSYLCPSCHCFDIVDESDWRGGERRRNWDCCSFAQFTLHTSGHNPRPDQQSRCRNRIMHKFKYFNERFGRKACVGCGRCSRVCGAGQQLANILTDIAKKAEA